jgi:hypothetical protein
LDISRQGTTILAAAYVTAHLILDLVDEQAAGEIMDYCEENPLE